MNKTKIPLIAHDSAPLLVALAFWRPLTWLFARLTPSRLEFGSDFRSFDSFKVKSKHKCGRVNANVSLVRHAAAWLFSIIDNLMASGEGTPSENKSCILVFSCSQARPLQADNHSKGYVSC